MPYAFDEHTADVRMRVSGKNRKELFRDALAGMTALARPLHPGAPVVRGVALEAPDATALLVDFLNEALLLMYTRSEAYALVEFEQLDEHSLKASLAGSAVERFEEDIKAATYHEARVARDASGLWSTTIIFDI